MVTAVAEKPKRKATTQQSYNRRVTVFERMTEVSAKADYSDRVDLENAIIKGVKVVGLRSISPARVLGFDSMDPYYYAVEALQAGASLYEGVDVHIDHPDIEIQKDGTRHAKDEARGLDNKFGWLENVIATQDGIYADLHYLKSHPMAARIVEFVLRKPEKIGLSHVADVIPEQKPDGRVVVVEIVKVDSVDLIGEKPGTVISLFESGVTMSKKTVKVREQEEKMPDDLTEQTVVEMEGDAPPEQEMMPETEQEAVEEELTASPPDEAVGNAFLDAIMACVNDDSLTDEQKIAKIGELLVGKTAAIETLAGGEAADEEKPAEGVAEQEAEGAEDEEKKPEPAMAQEAAVTLQQLAARVDKMATDQENYRRAVKTLESAGVRVYEARLQAISSMTDSGAIKATIDAFKIADGVMGKTGLPLDKTRSSGAKPAIESAATTGRQAGNKGMSYEEMLQSLGARRVPSSN